MATPSDDAARLIAQARAILRSKRANCCRHGVTRDHCADCTTAAHRDGHETTNDQRSA